MANPTTNFGWVMPTNTSLVTNLPADFNTFGQGVDTSMADLKGGTTGQILSKATNTDMDFTWITNDVGDITAVTAGTGITGGGTSGAVTVSFDQANFGGGQFSAGKNRIINSDFGIWARGTTFTSPASGTYTADRYATVQNGTGTSTISQQSFALGTAPVTGYEGTYFLRHQVTAVGTSTVNGVEQRIESVRTFANQTVTFSFYAKADAARTISARIDQYFGTGGSPSATVTGTVYTFSATTAWTRFSQTITLASIAGKTIGTSGTDALYFKIYNANTLNSQMDIWGVQVEAGSTATPFQTATGTIQGELAACQRYYYRVYPNTSGRYSTGQCTSTTTATFWTPYPVTMRTTPTALEQSGTATDYRLQDSAGNGVTCSSVPVFQIATTAGGSSVFTVATGIVAGNATIGFAANANSYLGWSAEL